MRQRPSGLVLLNFLVNYDLSGQTAPLYTIGPACLCKVAFSTAPQAGSTGGHSPDTL